MSRAGRSTEAGFTLIELAVVVALLALFTAMVVPRLPALDSGGVRGATRRIAGMTRFLYNEAALSGREHRLEFDLDHGTVRGRVAKDDGELVPVRGLPEEYRLPDGVRLVDVAVAGKEKITSGGTTTVIAPVGWLPETVVHLDNAKGEQLTLRLLSFTGTGEVHAGHRDF